MALLIRALCIAAYGFLLLERAAFPQPASLAKGLPFPVVLNPHAQPIRSERACGKLGRNGAKASDDCPCRTLLRCPCCHTISRRRNGEGYL